MNRLFSGGTVTGFSDAQLLERFVATHDPAAFEALVARHGPTVLSACRGFLKDPHDAEDAFQATFLILVKKSSTFRGQVALGPWLYKVSRRVAIRANAAAARRRALERKAGEMAAATVGPPVRDDQVKALHEELARIPEKFRQPIILCDLERLPQAQAAIELRLSERTLQRRLSQGRDRLRSRLIQRGVAIPTAMLATLLLNEARAGIPTPLLQATVRAALATVNHSMATGIVSAAAHALTKEVLATMLLKKITLASATLIAAGIVAWGASEVMLAPEDQPQNQAATTSTPQPKPQPVAKASKPQPPPKPAEPPVRISIRGRVLKPDGQPAPGATIYRTPYHVGYWLAAPYKESAITGPDGRFQFVADKQIESIFENEKLLVDETKIAAAAPNYAVAWTTVTAENATNELTLRLIPDDIPITGQIVDLEGKPVADATIHIINIRAAEHENLDPFLEALRAHKAESGRLEHQYLQSQSAVPAQSVTTDASGRFRLTGIGRNRLVLAQLDGPTIASQYLSILTRNQEPITAVRFPAPWLTNMTYYGASFRHVAAPTKPIVGIVRDKDTKKPLAGITIRSAKLATQHYDDQGLVRTTTDSQGRYKLTGMPKGQGNAIMAIPPTDQPYLVYRTVVPDSPGLDPVTADLDLKRGVWVEGIVTNKSTHTRMRQNVGYFSMPDNPNLGDYRSDGVVYSMTPTHDDGSYRLAAMPGPGLIMIRYERGYLRARERDDEFASKEVWLPTVPMPFTNYAAIAPINPANGDQSVKCDVTLDPGMTFSGTVVDPDGQPLPGFVAIGLGGGSMTRSENQPMETAQFTVVGFNPHEPRDLLFRHSKRRLVGIGHAPNTAAESITVKLEPGGTVTGRVIDADGQPRPGVEMTLGRHAEGELMHPDQLAYFRDTVTTDAQGRFRIDALAPGFRYILIAKMIVSPQGYSSTLLLGNELKPGESRDLGDVQLK